MNPSKILVSNYKPSMLQLSAIVLSVFLIFLIFLRLPQESVGLESFETANNLFGSPKSAERFLNILTVICIILYFGIAIQLNLASK